ncbi:MAG: sigma 54-interacting transcriptional regulator [Flavobacteriales bacterium]
MGPRCARVPITGGNGAWRRREGVARLLHEKSDHRVQGPFIEVNLRSDTRRNDESELFGHMKGSFTSAIKGPQRQVRAGQRWHALPGRGRRHELGRTSKGATGLAGKPHHTRWW